MLRHEPQPWTASTDYARVCLWVVLSMLTYNCLERKKRGCTSIVHAMVSGVCGMLLLTKVIDAVGVWFGHSMGYYVADMCFSNKHQTVYSVVHHALTIVVYVCIGLNGQLAVYGVQTQVMLSMGNIALHSQNSGLIRRPLTCGCLYVLSRIVWLGSTVLPLTRQPSPSVREMWVCISFWTIFVTNVYYWKRYYKKHIRSMEWT